MKIKAFTISLLFLLSICFFSVSAPGGLGLDWERVRLGNAADRTGSKYLSPVYAGTRVYVLADSEAWLDQKTFPSSTFSFLGANAGAGKGGGQALRLVIDPPTTLPMTFFELR